MSQSIDKIANPADREIFLPKFFHQIYKPLLPPHILRLKVGISIILLYNLYPPRLCNSSKIQLEFISEKVLEGMIIGGKYKE